MGDKKKEEDFVSGFKASQPDLEGAISKASDYVVGAAKDIGSAVSGAADYLSSSNSSTGGFLGDKDRYPKKKP